MPPTQINLINIQLSHWLKPSLVYNLDVGAVDLILCKMMFVCVFLETGRDRIRII